MNSLNDILWVIFMKQNVKFGPVWLDKIFKNDIVNTMQFCFINFSADYIKP